MRLLGEGKELKEIRAYIDAEYSQYGPSTDTKPVGEQGQIGCSEQVDTCGGAVTAVANPVDLDSIQMIVPVSETAHD
jgi:hypothetical protein